MNTRVLLALAADATPGENSEFERNAGAHSRVRWGVLGTGNIAHSFASGIFSRPSNAQQLIYAVGSRHASTAEAFGEAFAIKAPHRHHSYQALVDDPEVDAVYIATPHFLHANNTLMALRAGKAVLCEKPLAVTATVAEMVVTAARSTGTPMLNGQPSRRMRMTYACLPCGIRRAWTLPMTSQLA